MRWLFLAVVVVLISIVTWWKMPRSNVTTAANDRPPEVLVGSDERPRPHPASRPVPFDEAGLRAQIKAEREAERKSMEQLVATGRNKLVTRYESETIDQAWASTKRVELAEFSTSAQMEAIGAQPGNLSIDCRRTTCRVGADFPSRSVAEDWSTLYLSSLGSRLPNASLQTSANPDGSTHIDIYGLARQ